MYDEKLKLYVVLKADDYVEQTGGRQGKIYKIFYPKLLKNR